MRCHLFVITALLLIINPTAHGQKRDKQGIPRQYKRVHQEVLRKIVSGNAEAAIKQLQLVLKKIPDDAESYYMLTLANAASDRVDEAARSMNKAIKLGLPKGRFIAGPRDLMAKVRQTEEFKKLLSSEANKLIHGPMLGQVTGTSASFWVRTNGASLVSVLVAPKNAPKEIKQVPSIRVSKDNDFTAVMKVDGLKPSTEYIYDIYVDDHGFLDRGFDPKPGQEFRTASLNHSPTKFTVAFGGGAGYVPEHEHMWNTISATKPDALILLGDNTYIDDPKSPHMQKYCYYRRQSRPEFRKLVAKTPVYSIWDDHDFATNDSWGGPAIDEPAWKRPVWEIFTQNWANPGYGGGEKQPGCWYDYYIGDVHFIMLDGRYYRTDPKIEAPNMLGPVQQKWLRKTLKESKGAFKVLCSPVPWTFLAKGDSKDTWNGYKAERNAIFKFLSDHKIEGVVLMSADRHRSDLWKIDRSNGYALYEFNSSRLTNQHIHSEMKEAEFSYNKKQSFGLVTFDTTKKDPTANYKIMTIDGEEVFDFTLNRSKLEN